MKKTTTLRPVSIAVLFSLFISLAGFVHTVAGQSNYEHTRNKVDQTLRSNARINPSTLAVEMSIPIADMSGRGGASMPLVFNYSSKVWVFDPTGLTYGGQLQEEVRPMYSDDAMAGWTSSYYVPTIDTIAETYDCLGNAIGDFDSLPDGCGAYQIANRIHAKLPGGTTHELRKDDDIHNDVNGHVDKTGTYYAVDGTRVRLQWGTGGVSTLFMPDGGRYFFDSTQKCYKYIDRNGNTLTYNSTTSEWTDTMGRTLASPIPFTHIQRQNRGEGTQNFTVPGLGSSTLQYQLVWEKLSSGALLPGLSMSYVTGRCGIPYIYQSPSLFYNTTRIYPCYGSNSHFDPVVLREVILPNGQKYEFHYTEYGEIARIDYPTGAYERFVYDEIKGLGWDYQYDWSVATSYGQANRGVVDRYVAESIGATEQHWEYAASYQSTVHESNTYTIETTAPDLTKSRRYLERARKPAGNPDGNFGFGSILEGMEIEAQSLDSNDVLRSRKLSVWDKTTAPSPGHLATPQRDARLIREISILFEPGETNALATMSETVYDTTGSSDVAYFSSLNPKQTKTYNYVAVSASTAASANIATAIAWFSSGDLATVTEMDYLYDANYKARNINGLVTETRVKDPAGNVKAKTQISYDEASYGLSSSGTMPTAAASSWTDPLTELGSTIGAKRGLPTTVKSFHDIANGYYIETHSFYDQYGNVRKSRDGRGNDSEMQYDDDYAFAYPNSVITPVPDSSGTYGSNVAFESTMTYDYNTGLPLTSTDANGQTSTMEYADPLLRPTKVTAPNGHQTITEYGAGASPSTRWVKSRSQIDATNWKEAYQWFDGLGRAIKSQSVDSNGDVFVETQFDAVGRPWKISNPYRTGETVYWTENFYDTAGRPYKVKTPDNAEVETAYGLATSGSHLGTVVTVNDQAEKQRRSVTNALGQLVRVDEPTTSGLGTVASPNQATSYAYDTLNNLTTVTQGAQTRSFSYNSLSRLLTAANPESGTINYAYDNNGNLTGKTDARSIITSYTYDALNRVTQRSYTAHAGYTTPAVTYTYDNKTNAKGKLTKVSSSVSTTEYTAFDILGRVTSHKQTTDSNDYTTGYTYNLSGALIEQQYPSGRVVKNTLDTDGSLSQVQSKRSGDTYRNYANGFNYTAAGAVSSMRLGNGLWETTQFNSRLQPTQIGLGLGSATPNILKLDYSYGTTANNGNVQSQTITVPGLANPFVQSYTYDELNRISTAIETNNSVQTWKQAFTYDRYGNRNFNTSGSNTTTLPISFDPDIYNPTISTTNNRFDSGQGYSYDSSGNTTVDAEGRTFVYDAENKQIEVIESSTTIGQYFYDGDGKRVKKIVPDTGETTVFAYDAFGKQIAEYSTVVQTGSNAEITYTTNDSLGSPRVNTDATGQVISRHDYHPFGEEITRSGYGSDSIRKQFTGYERDDETSLDFAQTRYLSSGFGRFSSPDSFTNNTHVSDPQSWNLYSYVQNRPLTFVDPDGRKGTISWYTDSDGVVHVSLKATFAIYGAAGQNVSRADLKAYEKAMINGIRNILKKDFDVGGKTFKVSADVSAELADNEGDAISKGKDNIVELGYDDLEGTDPTGKWQSGLAGKAFGVKGESFDRMAMQIVGDPANYNGSYKPLTYAGETAAHEFAAHLLSGLHNTNVGERDSVFNPGGGMGGNQFYQSDFNNLFFGDDDPTSAPPPPTGGAPIRSPFEKVGSKGSEVRMANVRTYESPNASYRWVRSVKQ